MDFAFDVAEIRSQGYDVKGIVHIGAHHCEEAYSYHDWTKGRDKAVIWVEAHPDYFATGYKYLRENYSNQLIYCACLTNKTKIVDFHLASNEYASSILPFERELEFNPHVKDEGIIKLQAYRFDTWWPFIGYQKENYNVLIMDTQGSELYILQGMGEYLSMFDVIVAEFQTKETYKDVPKLWDLQEYLTEFDMILPISEVVEVLKACDRGGSGDALFVRRKT
jgi:FkbM family methyltransferase